MRRRSEDPGRSRGRSQCKGPEANACPVSETPRGTVPCDSGKEPSETRAEKPLVAPLAGSRGRDGDLYLNVRQALESVEGRTT